MKKYEWGVIGSGIAGIAIAEILTRQGHSVVLIEKNKTLASETTREFHEWLHTGALYTLVPDRLTTLRFILGSIDDLIEYYSKYNRMNMLPTVSGLEIDDTTKGWFNNNYINFKYRLKRRKITFPWIYGIARSIYLIERIHQHDWLRRRAGELTPFKEGRKKRVIKLINELLQSKELFKTVKTPDFTINSRYVLRDMLSMAVDNGLEISLNNTIKSIETKNNHKIIIGTNENIHVDKVAICNGSGIQDFTNVKTTTSYAPIAVVSGIPEDYKSFVELDYFPKNCINLLTKDEGFGLAGGISLSDRTKCDQYLDNVMIKHQSLVPNIKELSRYIGIKTEIAFKNEPRGYLFHIVEIDEGSWVVVPGKFTLAFSLAPEFYRRVYKKNPTKYFKTNPPNQDATKKVSNTVWEDVLMQSKEKNGINKNT